jgi:hypothetical protein
MDVAIELVDIDVVIESVVHLELVMQRKAKSIVIYAHTGLQRTEPAQQW